MILSQAVSHRFSPAVRDRGLEVYRGGRVTIVESSPFFLSAVVSGSSEYQVAIDWDWGTLNLSCDCPYASDHGECKHLWAVILRASEKRLMDISGIRRIVWGPDYEDREFDFEAPPPTPPPKAAPKKVTPPDWRQKLSALDQRMRAAQREVWPAGREIHYVIDLYASQARQRLVLNLLMRDRSKKGDSWNQAKELKCQLAAISSIPDPDDRAILSMLPPTGNAYTYYSYYEPAVGSAYELMDPLLMRVVELACRTGRLHLKAASYYGHAPSLAEPPLVWDAGEPWRFRIRVDVDNPAQASAIGELVRGEERLDLKSPLLLLPGGLVFTPGTVALLDDRRHFEWISALRESGAIQVPLKEAGELVATLQNHPAEPDVLAAPEIQFERVELPLKPRFVLRPPEPWEMDAKALRGEVFFTYGEWSFHPLDGARGVYVREQNRFVPRNRSAEEEAWQTLRGSGLPAPVKDLRERCVYKVVRSKVPSVVRTLVQAGWHVEAEGKAFRTAVSSSMSVTTDIDWFELNGDFDFGGVSAKLPDLLRAVRKGEMVVPLSDGAYGLLSQEWLDRLAPFAHFGDTDGGVVRFRRNQAGLLDALLATQPETTFDEGFARARDQLKNFGGIRPLPQPETFNGQLRDYQKDGLGWMEFLRRFEFGGCLADDMGVGKTAQVLAMFDARRAEGAAGAPSLVVVPRSLVFNWTQEAARFTPLLKVLDYTGLDRDTGRFHAHDIVLTTYGILRRDILALRNVAFDYVVLDEAQAVKNAASESAKAVRLLKSRHRLALSGTPVENHLGELASLVEFLNPGMLGPGGPVQLAGGALRNPPEETRTMLARALRPFILRRTKQQVARELPEKTEQTIFCEMKPAQRKLYDELRNYYRNSLLQRVAAEGLAKSKMHVLEALLRLRQAACHPGLLDAKRAGVPSAKIDTLLAQLEQVVEEGHKALVFSQFTSLLGLVKPLLEEREIRFEYLDGSTTNRQAAVERFQNDAACPLFLISLKAGGLGLNLTAAEYVYLLDPWWNPAVEAQAIDRTHRIGQTRSVFAYRLIAKDTVEEKVLMLQDTKRELANAIIGEDNSLIRDLRREDLEMLFG